MTYTNEIETRFARFAARGAKEKDEHGFFESACKGMLEKEVEWRAKGIVWSWVNEAPTWGSSVDLHYCGLPDPGREVTRRIRFSLLGGGQITMVQKYEKEKYEWALDLPEPIPAQFEWSFICYHPELRVTAQTETGLHRLIGRIDSGMSYEMSTEAVVFGRHTPQVLADRVAATFRLLSDNDPNDPCGGPQPDRFLALLDRSSSCAFCERPLRDHVSNLLGYGPVCARQGRLPHDLETASRVLKRRRELLACEPCT